MITREQLEDLDERGMAAWNNQDPDAFIALFGDGPIVWIDDTLPKPMASADEARAYMQGWFQAFPDLQSRETLRVFDVDQGLVAVELEFTGTNTGPLAMGGQEIPATGRSVVGNGVYFARARQTDDGVVMAEFRTHPNVVGMMAQLGLMG